MTRDEARFVVAGRAITAALETAQRMGMSRDVLDKLLEAKAACVEGEIRARQAVTA